MIELPLRKSATYEAKIMTICTTAEGMESFKFVKEGRTGVEIIGRGYDAAGVTETLRKKQKIVIEVPLNCAKCKKQVLTICTTAEGVTTVKFIRDGKDRVEIIGDGVDAAEVTQDLRNKLKFAKLVHVSKLD
ncbi:hypothetical protein PIB30_018728 [Stylosanthes scabra]|uniref:HMA domain-containing protein n=1 Tax=Stylosanthes scabra TaxID=79078 RepID=A0ABU6Y9Z0_9FABA|nr:hypothetical protein [Stylosanthes scabra]